MTTESRLESVSLGVPPALDLLGLPKGWSWTNLVEVAEFFNGDRSSNYPKQADFVVEGIPFVNTGHIDPTGRLALNEMDYISRACFDRLRGGKLKSGDIVYCLRGSTIGKIARVDLNEGAIASSLVIIRPKANIAQDYLYYFLSSPLGQRLVRQHDNGSAQPNLSVQAISKYPLPLPTIAEQREMLAVLNSFDDKIEQNRRTGRKLEELARAVFKAWFVDFEPVKAKAAGAAGFPGMPGEIFACLPNILKESPIGPVPEGWMVKPISEAFDVNPPRRLAKGADAPYLDMKNMPTTGHAPDAWERRPHGSGMKFINGDTLVARITPCLENGKTAYVDFLNDGEVAWGSTEYIVLRTKPPLPPIFAYCLARMEPFRDFAIQNMSGTSGRQRVAASAMEHYRIAVPDPATARSFGEVVEPQFLYIRASKAESAKLATLRDYLLPRLLSGRVRVRHSQLSDVHRVGPNP